MILLKYMQSYKSEKANNSADFSIKMTKLMTDSIKNLLGNISYQILLIMSQSEDPLYVKEIKSKLELNLGKSLTDQTIYYHLRKLKDLGFINQNSDQILDENDRIINIQKYYLSSQRYLIDFTNSFQDKFTNRPKLLENFNFQEPIIRFF